jgi:hypothetical protein
MATTDRITLCRATAIPAAENPAKVSDPNSVTKLRTTTSAMLQPATIRRRRRNCRRRRVLT